MRKQSCSEEAAASTFSDFSAEYPISFSLARYLPCRRTCCGHFVSPVTLGRRAGPARAYRKTSKRCPC